MWPDQGDYDFNDVVVRYRLHALMDDAGLVTRLNVRLRIVARGASQSSGFAIHVPEIPVTTVTAAVGCGTQSLAPELDGQTFVVLSDVADTLPPDEGDCLFSNTSPDCLTPTEGREILLTLAFDRAVSGALLETGLDPFIFRVDAPGRKVHLPGFAPTTGADFALFGTGDDASEAPDLWYMTVDHKPWGLDIPGVWDWPTETTEITTAYPQFAVWAESAGTRELAWWDAAISGGQGTPVGGEAWDADGVAVVGACVDPCADTLCAGGFVCQDVGDVGTCANVDECALGLDSCATNATCTDTAGNFACVCNAGFEGDGGTVPFVRASSGQYHTLAIRADGTLWGWGANWAGQVGDGTTDNRFGPVQVGTDDHWALVSAGDSFSLAIKTDGSLWVWGNNWAGHLGVGDIESRPEPTAVSGGGIWNTVAAGGAHSLGIRTDGTLWAWGDNSVGQLGLGDKTSQLEPRQVGSAKDWESVAAGYWFSAAIKRDGSLWTWGGNWEGQLGLGDYGDGLERVAPTRVGEHNDWAAVSASEQSFCLALKTDGSLWAWGNNSSGQLGYVTEPDSLSAVPGRVDPAVDWADVSAGGDHSMAIKTDGTLWAWGANGYGQLGLGTTDDTPIVTRVGLETDWRSLAVGQEHTVVLKSDGVLWAWGAGGEGQLGYEAPDGSIVRTPVPTCSDVDECFLGLDDCEPLAHEICLNTVGGYWCECRETRQWGTTDDDVAYAVAMDGSGNVLVTGDTYAGLDGNLNLGSQDAVLTRWNADGTKAWTRQWGSNKSDQGYGVAIDPSGNIVVGGMTYGSLGGPNQGYEDLFVTKRNADGNEIWTRQKGSSGADYGFAVAVDGSGNAFVTGLTRGFVDGQSYQGNEDVILVKWDTDGNWAWTRVWGTQNYDTGHGVAVNSAGEVFVAGRTGGAMGLGSNAGGDDVFLSKFNTDGTLLWTKQLGSTAWDYGASVSVDGAGNIYVAGYTNGNLDGNGSRGGQDVFLARWNPDGTLAWVRQWGTTTMDQAESVTVTTYGDVFVTGWTYGSMDGNRARGGMDVFLTRWNADGVLAWTRQWGSPAEERAWGVAANSAADFVVAGYTSGSLDGSTNPSDRRDLFLTTFPCD